MRFLPSACRTESTRTVARPWEPTVPVAGSLLFATSSFGAPLQSALPLPMLVSTPRSARIFRHQLDSQPQDRLDTPPADGGPITAQRQLADLDLARPGRRDVHRAGLDPGL